MRGGSPKSNESDAERFHFEDITFTALRAPFVTKHDQAQTTEKLQPQWLVGNFWPPLRNRHGSHSLPVGVQRIAAGRKVKNLVSAETLLKLNRQRNGERISATRYRTSRPVD